MEHDLNQLDRIEETLRRVETKLDLLHARIDAYEALAQGMMNNPMLKSFLPKF